MEIWNHYQQNLKTNKKKEMTENINKYIKKYENSYEDVRSRALEQEEIKESPVGQAVEKAVKKKINISI